MLHCRKLNLDIENFLGPLSGPKPRPIRPSGPSAFGRWPSGPQSLRDFESGRCAPYNSVAARLRKGRFATAALQAEIISFFWKSRVASLIILGTANLLVICWPFPIMTINGTSHLNIYLIVISIQPHDCGTHFLRLVDVLLHWVRFVLIWRHISGQSHIRHSFYLPIILPGSWPIFRQLTMALIILMICASRMRFGAD